MNNNDSGTRSFEPVQPKQQRAAKPTNKAKPTPQKITAIAIFTVVIAIIVLFCANLQILADILNTARANFVFLFRDRLAAHCRFGIFNTPYAPCFADFDYLRNVYNGYTHR